MLGKTICENYKTKKRRKAKPEELMIFRDTHEAIVDEETWQLAHRLKRTIRKPSYPDRPSNPLTGLLYCADCGCKMTHRQPSPTKKKVFDADNAYICGGYRHLTRDCTMHFIKTSTVEKLVLTAIREVSAYVREDEKEFIRIVRDAASAGQEQTAREQKKRLRQVAKAGMYSARAALSSRRAGRGRRPPCRAGPRCPAAPWPASPRPPCPPWRSPWGSICFSGRCAA